MGEFADAAPGTAVRRPAAAGRAGPSARAQPARAAAGRAARRAGCAAAQAVAARAARPAARGRDHVRLRDARPGGSADDERPHRGARRRAGRAGRRPAGDLLGAGDHLRRGIPRVGQHLRRRARCRLATARPRAPRSTRRSARVVDDAIDAGPAAVVIRPERIAMAGADDRLHRGATCFAGRCATSSISARRRRCTSSSPAAHTLTVEVANHDGPASVTHLPGTTVQCVCTPDAVRVLRRSAAARACAV